MIDIESIEGEIILILKADEATIAAHKEITKSDEKMASLVTLAGFAHVDSYQGNIMEILAEDTIPLPAALVIYGGANNSNAAARDGAKGTVQSKFGVFIVGGNLMGRKDASLDVRKFLTAVRTVLNGLVYQDRTLLWTAEQLSVINNQGVCVYEQNYEYKDWLTT